MQAAAFFGYFFQLLEKSDNTCGSFSRSLRKFPSTMLELVTIKIIP